MFRLHNHNQNLKSGDILTLDNLSGKIFEKQYTPVRESNYFIGKKIKKDISKGDPIFTNDIEI